MKELTDFELELISCAYEKEKLGWSFERDAGNFDCFSVNTFLGKRIFFRPKDNVTYTWLQNSRGLQIDSKDINQLVEAANNCVMSAADVERMDELRDISLPDKTFIELGFRQPVIIKHMMKRYRSCMGFDINKMNVLIAHKMGYDAQYINLGEAVPDLKRLKAGVVVAYHVFEHVVDPITSIIALIDNADDGTYFHLEVPIENDCPSLRYSHMFGFYEGDLAKILLKAGCEILSVKETSNIDRVLARKYAPIQDKL